jgi:RibD C-terminal domain
MAGGGAVPHPGVRRHPHQADPWERPGGTTFHFVNDGIESALLQAREAAGDRDVRIAGGAETIQEYLDSGLIDEFSITLAPVLFGTGIRLFDRVDPARLALDQARTDASSRVTHLTYTAVKRQPAFPQRAVPACPRRARCRLVRSARQSGRVIEFAGLDAADDGADLGLDEEQRGTARVAGVAQGGKLGRCRGGSSPRKDLPLMSHHNAPLSFEGRLRLVQRCQQRPISHVAAEMGISRACASKWGQPVAPPW